MSWTNLASVPPLDLKEARLALHYGSWLVGSTADSLLPAADDDSHTNLGIDGGRLCSRPLDAATGPDLQLDMEELALIFREGGADLARLPLAGQSLAEALRWIDDRASSILGKTVRLSLRQYSDFPRSPLSDGGGFAEPSTLPLGALTSWFAVAHEWIEGVLANHPESSPARVWPHHFDLGALIPLDGEKVIGLGFSPGDSNYEQPYFYCSPYPQPDAHGLPELSVGHWHTEGFLSAVLTAESLLAAASPRRAAADYADSGLKACRQLLA